MVLEHFQKERHILTWWAYSNYYTALVFRERVRIVRKKSTTWLVVTVNVDGVFSFPIRSWGDDFNGRTLLETHVHETLKSSVKQARCVP